MITDEIRTAFRVIEQNAAEAKLTLSERIQSQEALKIVWKALNDEAGTPPIKEVLTPSSK